MEAELAVPHNLLRKADAPVDLEGLGGIDLQLNMSTGHFAAPRIAVHSPAKLRTESNTARVSLYFTRSHCKA
ncbi:MAG: hypothetical protein OXI87_16525 [Albidovulum sp.]|nr:hypothetical protein [Albidovulum sp.]